MMRTYVRFLLDPMNVQQVVMPVSEAVYWTVLGDDGDPIESVKTPLTYLSALERSPNTQHAYTTSLKLWFEFLEWVDIGWADVGINEVARFVSWFRASGRQRDRAGQRNCCALAGHDQSAPRRLCSDSTSTMPVRVSRSPPNWWRGVGSAVAPTNRSCTTSPKGGRCRHDRSS